MKKPTGTE